MADRDQALGPLEISFSAPLAIGDDYTGDGADAIYDQQRDAVALYWGGMGARDQNFYNRTARLMGYGAEAEKIQNLYLDGHKADAATAVPRHYLEQASLVGPKNLIRERLAQWSEAGITVINVSPKSPDPADDIAQLRQLLEDTGAC